MRGLTRLVTDAAWPDPGTRVAVRYRRAAGSVPPLTDVIGTVMQLKPTLQIRTKTGAVIDIALTDVSTVRILTDAPVRTSQIRALEHAAALAWPGSEYRWLEGWFLRSGPGASWEANSAVPLAISAGSGAVPAIIEWYARRHLTPRLALPERLVRLPGTAEHSYRMLVRDVGSAQGDPSVRLASHPDDSWRQLHPAIPVHVLTSVSGGEVVFAAYPNVATARAAVTDGPDGTRWVGLSALRLADHPQAPQAAEKLCETLLAWGAGHGAAYGYLRVRDGDGPIEGLLRSLRFNVHHRGRFQVPIGS